MKKILENKCFILLVFLAIFGLSVGLFDNYRDLWLDANNLSPKTISHIISISYLVTVLILFYFTLRVSASKLKFGITIALILKLITSTTLIVLNNTSLVFLIKFCMFFDIAFTEVILSSIYPLMLNISKGDLLYTKKDVVESLFNKLGFLIVSILIGRTIGSKVIDYNICLLLSTIFVFLSFIILINTDIESTSSDKPLNIKESLNYFNKNKVLYLYLTTSIISSIAWSAMLGMPLLTLTKNLRLSTTTSSFIILGIGIISNILAIIIVKYFRSKNDHLNLFIKFGIRVILYLLCVLIGNKTIILITIIYMLLTDCTHNFIFSSYFINNIKSDYSLLLVVLKYCASLIGKGIGIFICGLVFNLPLKLIAIPTLIIASIHYILASILITKKRFNLTD